MFRKKNFWWVFCVIFVLVGIVGLVISSEQDNKMEEGVFINSYSQLININALPVSPVDEGSYLGTIAFLIGVPALGIGMLAGCNDSGVTGTGVCDSGWFYCEEDKCCRNGSGCCSYRGRYYACCPSGYPLFCPSSDLCYTTAGSSPCGISGEIVCGGPA